MKIPITQSEAWQKLQDDLGERAHLKRAKNYQYLAIEKHTPAGNYLYLPYGPVADTECGFQDAIGSILSLASTISAMFIRIEPRSPSAANILTDNANLGRRIKAIKKTKDLNPKETWLLDLTGTDDDLRARLPSRLLRYYKNREKQGITIETSRDPDDIRYLLDLQKALAREKGISTFSENYLKTELKQPFATLYLVKHRRVTDLERAPHRACRDGGGESPAGPVEELLAAGLVFDDGDTRYNLQGAQSDEGRKLHATGILTIQLILDARAKNLQTFDFWGIAPEGAPANHPWAGFTAFKKTFAGYEMAYVGTHDLVLRPARYQLYSLLRRLRRLGH